MTANQPDFQRSSVTAYGRVPGLHRVKSWPPSLHRYYLAYRFPIGIRNASVLFGHPTH